MTYKLVVEVVSLLQYLATILVLGTELAQGQPRGIEQATATYYLEKLVNLENADAAWLLYQILGEEGASQRFMRLAALGDVAEAQLAFAMSTDMVGQFNRFCSANVYHQHGQTI